MTRTDVCTICGGPFQSDRDGLWSGDKREHRNIGECFAHAQQEVERLRGACLAAYRAWVQEAGSSQFVKDEAVRLLIDIVRPAAKAKAEQAGGGA